MVARFNLNHCKFYTEKSFCYCFSVFLNQDWSNSVACQGTLWLENICNVLLSNTHTEVEYCQCKSVQVYKC